MVQWVDFAEIRSRVSLEAVLFQYYNLDNLKPHGDKVIGPCPVHGGDSPRAFHADLAKNIWHCFSQCRRGGNQLDFISLKEGISIREAAIRLQEAFLESPRPPATPNQPVKQDKPEAKAPQEKDTPGPPVQTRNPPLNVTLNLKAEHPYLINERKLTLETIQHFGLGYCSRGIMRGTISFPIHDESSQLVAYAGRRLKPSDIKQYGKYKFPKGFRKELVLYNYHQVKHLASEHGLILVEGFFSVLQLRQTGFENVVASMGCDISEYQADLLSQAKDVVVLFDGNEAGWKGAQSVRDKLTERVPVRVAYLPEGMEPEDLSVRALNWLIKGMRILELDSVTFQFSKTAEYQRSDE